jgi:tetratricopeptide (TPR) repeat protein
MADPPDPKGLADGGAPREPAVLLLTRAYALLENGRAAEAIACFDRALAEVGESWETLESAVTLVALDGKGRALILQGDLDEADAVHAMLLERFGGGEELAGDVAEALYERASALRNAGAHERALAAAEELLARLGASSPLHQTAIRARGLLVRADALRHLDRVEDALDGYGKIAAEYEDCDELLVRRVVARALLWQARVLQRDERLADAMAAYERLLDRFGDDHDAEVRADWALALNNYAVSLRLSGRPMEAVMAWNRLQTGGGERLLERRLQVGMRVEEGLSLSELGRLDEAIAAFAQAVARFHEDSDPEIRVMLARALGWQGWLLHRAGRYREAIASYDELTARYAQSPEPGVREAVMSAARNRGQALAEIRGREQAIAAFDEHAAELDDDASQP